MARPGLDTNTVVTAAAALADAEGLEAVTLAKLAAQLGVKSPSLYVHVDGLSGLRRQIAARGARELTADLQAAVAGRSGLEALTALAGTYRAYARAHPGTYAATQNVANLEGPEASAAATAALDVIYAVLRGYAIDDDAATHAARIVRSALHGFVSLEVGNGFGFDLDLDESFAILVSVLDRGLRSPAPTA
jgi:AcrR family transcriptional regulator